MSTLTERRDGTQAAPGFSLEFGPFKLMPRRRLLLDSGRPVHLGSRALDILIALADRAGEVVGKSELIALVWPSTFVGEANLRVHIAALRKALREEPGGARYISNVIGRGYCFVAEASSGAETPGLGQVHVPQDRRGPAPVPACPPVGREAIVTMLAESLKQHRFLSIVGPAGIGKTTVALAVATILTSHFDGRVHVADFASISDPAECAGVLARALASSGTASIGTERTLLLFDHCDHVVGAAADLAEQVMKDAPGLHILAASREALRAQGEHIHRLGPLDTPPADCRLSASEALDFPAVALFVERASARDDSFDFRCEHVAIVADICRRLEGNPLAIDMAAAQTDIVGLRDLAALIDNRFLLTAQGQRTACARQQTLEAALDWSHETLMEGEQAMLRRLSGFVDSFTMEAAIAVAAPDLDADQAFTAIVNLVGKSLVAVDTTTPEATYRLEDMTRAYIVEKLGKGEKDRMPSQDARP